MTVTSVAITRGAALTTATVLITQATWTVHLKGLIVPVVTLVMVSATAAATTKSAFTMAAIVQHPFQPPAPHLFYKELQNQQSNRSDSSRSGNSVQIWKRVVDQQRRDVWKDTWRFDEVGSSEMPVRESEGVK